MTRADAPAKNPAVRAALLACLGHQAPKPDPRLFSALNEAAWSALLAVAREQRVRPLVLRGLANPSIRIHVPDRCWQALEADCRQIARHMLRMQAELANILAALERDGIPAVVLKGACLGPEVYGNPALREMNDLDVLVPRTYIERAVDVVMTQGYVPLHPFSIEMDLAVSPHVTRLIKTGIAGVELHVNLTPPDKSHSIDPDELWTQALPMRVERTTARRLSAEDLLLHLAWHAAYQHQFEFGLRPACDIAEICRVWHQTIDWDALVERAIRWRWDRGVFLALTLAQQVGADVPSHVFDRLLACPPNPDVTKAVVELLWTNKSDLMAFPSALGDAATAQSAAVKFKTIWRSFFLPRAHFLQNGVKPTTKALSAAYLSRFVSLFRRYSGHAVRSLTHADVELISIAERRTAVRRWLAH